jgi:hypothetical protein
MNELTQLLRELEAAHFFGSLELKFEPGHGSPAQEDRDSQPMQPSYGDNRGAYDRNQSR